MCQLAWRGGHHAKLVALCVLLHLNLATTNQDRAFGEYHIACEDAELLEIVITQGIGLDIHGLVAVGFFRKHPWRHQSQNAQ